MLHVSRIQLSNVTNPEAVSSAYFPRVDNLVFTVKATVKLFKVVVRVFGVVVGCNNVPFVGVIKELLEAKFSHSILQDVAVFHVSMMK